MLTGELGQAAEMAAEEATIERATGAVALRHAPLILAAWRGREVEAAQLPRSLGVRIAEESVADALVRGTVSSYDEVVSSVRPTLGGSQNDQVPVVQRQVRIVFNAEIYDLRQDQVIWRAQSQSVLGSFAENESQDTGRARAIEELVNRFVEGAQSQW